MLDTSKWSPTPAAHAAWAAFLSRHCGREQGHLLFIGGHPAAGKNLDEYDKLRSLKV
jgi:hypothetical protein